MVQTLPRCRFFWARVLLSSLAISVMSMKACFAQADINPVPPIGYWLTKDSESIVHILPCADVPGATATSTAKVPGANEAPSFCGVVVWLKDPLDAKGNPKIDDLNKDPEKKNKPVIGLEILIGLIGQDDHWAGEAYNPDDGKYYDITFKVKTDKAPNDQADLRGCILRVLCRTETFTRTTDVPGGDPTLVAASAASKPAKPHGAKKDAPSK